MLRKIFFVTMTGFLLMFIGVQGFAEEKVEDHPLISRYQGAEVYDSELTEYGEYVLPMAPLERNTISESRRLEGKITHIQYTLSESSQLEILRNYQSTLRDAGFKVLFEHSAQSWSPTMYWVRSVYDPHGIYWKSSRRTTFVGNGFRYLAAVMEHPDGDVYISLYTTPTREGTIIQQDVIETLPMQTDLITVNPDYMRDEIERDGMVTLHGLQFYPDSAQMTPESLDLLKEVAAYLRQNSSLNFYIVGHTTTLGPHDNLMELSRQRAESCAQALIRDYGIAADRLFPAGAGGLSPVASNADAETRARNRQIELVLRYKGP